MWTLFEWVLEIFEDFDVRFLIAVLAVIGAVFGYFLPWGVLIALSIGGAVAGYWILKSVGSETPGTSGALGGAILIFGLLICFLGPLWLVWIFKILLT